MAEQNFCQPSEITEKIQLDFCYLKRLKFEFAFNLNFTQKVKLNMVQDSIIPKIFK